MSIKHYRVKFNVVTGEACTAYIFYPKTVERVKKLIPKAKFIAILRNPVDRTYSHYHHELRRQAENLTFEKAIAEENNRLKKEQQEKLLDSDLIKSHFEHHSYLHRGHYAEQLERWFKFFPKDQFLILTLDELQNFHKKTMNLVFDFLSLPEYELENVTNLNVGSYSDMEGSTRKFLVDYFKPHNERLYTLLDREFDWDK